ncbi:MAG: hypothetical protein OJF50_003638 [Nitrospira sp.]|jgi:hypothetical protein|nr:hypothetical protein [Nitrospira sp.]
MLKKATNFVLASLTRHWALTGSRPSANVKTLGHCRLTDSPARTNVALFLHRAVRLIILRVADLIGRPFSAS